jgi:lipopolysaccharide transport system ATP-binding protein
MPDIAIQIEDLSKQYRLGTTQAPYTYNTLRESVMRALTVPFRRLSSSHRRNIPDEATIWALRDVSFAIEFGEVLGIVGRNGAGKSTLLKLLSRIIEPTRGEARIYGRVGSLLEVGTGFHPELTGRENIFLNGAILGMRRAELMSKFDEIVAFAEIEKFLDTPVKRYSSGMYVRLAFAVAAHLEPEILLIDEVLAVGDAAFQTKCLRKMGEVAREGRTVLFVSHNMAAITSLCTRSILIDDGRLVTSGEPHSVVDAYLSRSHTNASLPVSERNDRKGNGRVRFTNISILNSRFEPVDYVTPGQEISICLDYDIADPRRLENTIIQITFSGVLGQPLFACLSRVTRGGVLTLTPGARIFCHIPSLPLLPGTYTFGLWCKVGEIMEDWVLEAGKVVVAEGDYFGTGRLPTSQVGDFVVAHDWSVR